MQYVTVSIHAPTRDATPTSISPPRVLRFNPRTHTGCDRGDREQGLVKICFNPRTHTGCDPNKITLRIDGKVSIHAPTRDATLANYKHYKTISEFQSTHPHGMRLDLTAKTETSITLVSIHAPTRDATHRDGAMRGSIMFQSTHPHGMRLGSSPRLFLPAYVSIHAPTRDATPNKITLRIDGKVSIHAPTRDATSSHKDRCKRNKFQSTHPHGMRQLASVPISGSSVFQSTHPHGMRQRPTKRCNLPMIVSIHAPTRDATP